MKSIQFKIKIITAAVIILVISVAILFTTNNTLSVTIKDYFASHEIAASIVYSALFIIGFNVLIFAIGYFVKDKGKKTSFVKKAYKRTHQNRRRRIESRQFSVLSHIK